MTGHYRGPFVTVTVGRDGRGKVFDLPKGLLCHYSPVLDRAFNGPFKESLENTFSLPDHSPGAFEMVIQWMFISQVVLARAGEDPSADITHLLNFFVLADEIDLLGPFDSVVHQLKMTLRETHTSLLPEHIRRSAQLPSGNPVRKLFAEACVQAYLYHTQALKRPRHRAWTFEEELSTLDGFAADLLKAVSETSKLRKIDLNTGAIVVRDPISNKDFMYH